MKNRKRILKIRPFNMANFSGGSGYLIFSLFYQALALLPGVLIVWLMTLFKLPKNENGEIITSRASKRFYSVTIPLTVIFIIAATVLSAYLCYGYGSLSVYAAEIALIGIAPALCSFFVLRHFHAKIVFGDISIKRAVFSSLIIIIAVIIGLFLISLVLNSILESVEYDFNLVIKSFI